MNKDEEQEEIEDEFNKRIKTYDTLNFLRDEKILANIMNRVIKMDQRTIAELTSQQLQALPLRR